MTAKLYELTQINKDYGVIELDSQILIVELKTGHVVERIIINYV